MTESLENLNIKKVGISLLPENNLNREWYKISYNKKPLKLKIEDIKLDHQFSGILDSRTAPFDTKKINPLYVYYNKDDEITKKLKELSDQIKERFNKKIKYSFIDDKKITFKFKSSNNVITTKIDGISNIRNTDKLIDKLGTIPAIDVIVRLEILSNKYGNFLQMVMEKLTVHKKKIENIKDFLDSEESEISIDDDQ